MNKMWKAIKDYEGLYETSNDGSVKSLDRYVRHVSKSGREGLKLLKGRILKPRVKDNGYLYVALCKDGTIYNHYIHRLVAEAFIPNPEGLPEVDHIDTDRTNNRVENLRWASCKSNRNNPLTKIKKCHVYKGERAIDVARRHGITSQGFHQRLARGLSIEEACTTPPLNIKYYYKGKPALDTARANNINRWAFQRRVAKGWSVEKACTTPLTTS